jgi:hypothetical protein
MIQVGDLVKIRESFSRKVIGKMALVTARTAWNARIHILETGEQDSYALSKLEKL